jgi:predicted dehydrogenase
MATGKTIRVGVVGCGAAAELVHLPALKQFTDIRVCAFADHTLSRARYLSKSFSGAIAVKDYLTLLQRVDAVILTTPNALHAVQTIACLKRGVHVFCEKPMATSHADARRMVQEGKRRGKVVSIGMVRRYFTVYERIKQLIDNHALGSVTAFLCEEGYPFEWPLQSTYAFEKKRAGGGVLMDLGSHVVDTLIYLFGDIKVQSYFDDSYGGVEANCVIHLRYHGVSGKVRLSREKRLKNMLSISFERGTVTSEIPQYSDITITENGLTTVQHVAHDNTQAVYRELRDFFDAIAQGGVPRSGGAAIIPSIALMERCYAIKKPLTQPWLLPKP